MTASTQADLSAVAQPVPSEDPPEPLVDDGQPTPTETPESESELDRIDPVPDTYTFADGTVVQLERLRTRQFFKMLRIFTHGSVDVLAAINLDPRAMNTQQFTENLLAVLIFAVPESEQESIDFLRSMVKPAPVHVPDDVPPAKVAEAATALERQAESKVNELFQNPEIDDLLGLVEAVIRREAPEIKALGKRLSGMLQAAQKTGNLPEALTETSESSEASPERST